MLIVIMLTFIATPKAQADQMVSYTMTYFQNQTLTIRAPKSAVKRYGDVTGFSPGYTQSIEFNDSAAAYDFVVTGTKSVEGNSSSFSSGPTVTLYPNTTYMGTGGVGFYPIDGQNHELPRNDYRWFDIAGGGDTINLIYLGTGTYRGPAPIITAPGDTTIIAGDPFDPMEGVSAHDTQDGDLTSKIQVAGKVDHQTAGRYELTYTVTDSDGNQAAPVKRVVTVRSGGSVIACAPSTGDPAASVRQVAALLAGVLMVGLAVVMACLERRSHASLLRV